MKYPWVTSKIIQGYVYYSLAINESIFNIRLSTDSGKHGITIPSITYYTQQANNTSYSVQYTRVRCVDEITLAAEKQSAIHVKNRKVESVM